MTTTTTNGQLATLFCDNCGKKRPFRFSGIQDGRFIHQCVICDSGYATDVAEGSLRQARPVVNDSPFHKLHRIIMRDATSYEVINTGDLRFFKIRYLVNGLDEYEVEYMDYKPVEIIHQFKRMNQGHKKYPWLNGNGRQAKGD